MTNTTQQAAQANPLRDARLSFVGVGVMAEAMGGLRTVLSKAVYAA